MAGEGYFWGLELLWGGGCCRRGMMGYERGGELSISYCPVYVPFSLCNEGFSLFGDTSDWVICITRRVVEGAFRICIRIVPVI